MNWYKIISFTNKKIRKKFKVLVAFLINQKIGGQLGFLSRSFFYQNHSIKIMRKPFSQKKKNMQISFYLFLCGEPKSKHALIQKRSEIKYKKTSFFQLKVRSDFKT